MSAGRWQRVQDLFAAAADLAGHERDAFLAGACGDDAELRAEVEALLAADSEAHDLLDGNALDVAAPLIGADLEGRDIGPYRVRRRLGEGGMGVVHLAERADGQFEQTVALKLVRHGLGTPDRMRRFRAERQILARLEHPGIARLLDGGVTRDGLPWFAMEYVEGEPIDRWCRERNLDVDARLQLFLAVCDAVQYAQNNLVVHRDLKPANILVTAAGRIKLLDFGIAKLTAADGEAAVEATRTGAAPMTAAYAAPEQVRGEPVTIATDVYALGLVLYELLTGQRAYDVAGTTPAELERIVCTTEPARPSRAAAAGKRTAARLQRRLRGDLDNICLKALAKEPRRRYASPAQLADDIRLHLAGLPIQARPATFGYLARKAARRYRRPLLVAAVLVAAALGLATYSARRIADERDRARVEAAKAQQVAEFLTSIFAVADPEESRGEDVTASQILAKGTERVETALASQPDVQAEMLVVLGRVHVSLGMFDEARRLLERAVAIEADLHGRDSPEYGRAVANYARLRYEDGAYADADSLLGIALATRRRAFGERSPQISEILTTLGHVRARLGRYDEAETAYREAMACFGPDPGPDQPAAANAMSSLALTLLEKGELTEAETLFRRALDLQRRGLGPDHPEVANTLFNLGLLLGNRGDWDEAIAVQQEVLALDRKLYGDVHPNVAYDLNNLAFLRREQGAYDEAETYARQSVAMRTDLLGPDHPQTLASRVNLALCVQARGDWHRAEALYRELLAATEATFGPDHVEVAGRLNNLGWVLNDLGRPDEAVDLHRRALAITVAAVGEVHKSTGIACLQLGRALLETGALDGAEQSLRRGLAIARELYGEDNVFTATLEYNLAEAQLAAGDLDAAETSARTAVAEMEAATDADTGRVLAARAALADVLQARGDLPAAESLLRQVLAGRQQKLPPDHPAVAWTMVRLGAVLLGRGDVEEAAPLLAAATQALTADLPADHPHLLYARGLQAVCQHAQGDAGAAAVVARVRDRLEARGAGTAPLVRSLAALDASL